MPAAPSAWRRPLGESGTVEGHLGIPGNTPASGFGGVFASGGRASSALRVAAPAAVPAAAGFLATSEPVWISLAAALHAARLGGDAEAVAIAGAAGLCAAGAVMVRVRAAAEAWRASTSFRDMVRGFYGRGRGLDGTIERDVRAFWDAGGRPPLLVSLQARVADAAFGGQPPERLYQLLPDGAARRLWNGEDAVRAFGDAEPAVVVTVEEIGEPTPLADSVSVAWPGHLRVTARADGAVRGEWVADWSGRLRAADGAWAVQSRAAAGAGHSWKAPAAEAPDPDVSFARGTCAR